MIEARPTGADTAPKADTPETITVSMIIEDLESGTDRAGIQTKYGLKTWEVTEMFKHPKLKGRKAKKVRKLSFNFVDDTNTVDPNQTSIPVELQGYAELPSDGPDFDTLEDVHTETSMVTEATPELKDVDDTLEF